MTSSNQFESVLRTERVGTLSVGKFSLDQDWANYTPVLGTGAWGTTVINQWRYRVIGRTLSVRGSVSQTVGGTLGSGAYSFSLPTGCVARVFNLACGPVVLTGATKSILGFAGIPPGPQNAFTVSLCDPTSGTIVLTPWTAAYDAEFRLTATFFTMTVSLDVELDPSSPILK